MMLIGHECGPLQANCYILASGEGAECVIIDPGMEAEDWVRSTVTARGLVPVAVLATHGHIDHVADAAPLADHFEVPVWIHLADRHLLTDPAAGLSAEFAGWVRAVWPNGLPEPGQVRMLDLDNPLEVAGFRFRVVAAPGHTAGSVIYHLEGTTPTVFSGDVLFAGAIGRTDLPGSDPAAMTATLRGPILALPDEAAIYPGHGPSTTMAVERVSNPFLREGQAGW